MTFFVRAVSLKAAKREMEKILGLEEVACAFERKKDTSFNFFYYPLKLCQSLTF